GFAMSLLVSETHYSAVSAWVNGRFLEGTKLVYHRVPERQPQSGPDTSHDELRLRDTLAVQPGGYETFLHHELSRRADHVCAESLEHFRPLDRAVTLQGQNRSGRRHEKDDRYSLDDPSR